ncbi:hypothetical protein D3C87_1880650 [compost metagenome]
MVETVMTSLGEIRPVRFRLLALDQFVPQAGSANSVAKAPCRKVVRSAAGMSAVVG